MIDPATGEPGTTERKVELDQTVDYAVQLLGWERAEFLASIIEVANVRLAMLDEEARLAGGTPVGDEGSGKRLP
ncbi:hypothetical protein GB927_026670 [Shinella sp. CPCC 100929]|uniref:Uncharacterized protein n=1 Tax=Shinella lacus TaxID=2654216 RepID=A0ABT1REW9_9HYPH|nr:hypothetical protein [Shinella lacus]MCQ4633649.1 hypothetical protein [Shinella lacus]